MPRRGKPASNPSKLSQAMTAYLRANKDILNIAFLERAIGATKGTLRHVVVNTQPFPEHWVLPLAMVLRKKLYSKVLDRMEEVEQLENKINQLVNVDEL